MDANSRAEKITPCWQPRVKVCECPMHVIRPLIATAIRKACKEAFIEGQEKGMEAQRVIDEHIVKDAIGRGFRAGQIAMREEAAKTSETYPAELWRDDGGPQTIADAIRALPIDSEEGK